jgi:large subunit ribosomal protein L32e
MKDASRHLEARNVLKKRKPFFIRQEGHKKKKLGLKWRRPKGMHSKLRRMLRGNRARVEPGWGSPATVKGLSKEGLKKVVVGNVAQLAKIDASKEGAVISSTVGMRKKVELLKKAKELGVKVLNANIDNYLARFEEMQKAKDEKKAKTSKEREEKQKEREKKAAEKEKESKAAESGKQKEGEAGGEEQKEKEKKEFDKLLTKKDAA